MEEEEEGTSNHAKELSFSSSPSNCELVNGNGFSIATDSGGNSSGAAEVRTYKRRRVSKKSSPERKHRKYRREEVGAALHFENQRSKELVDSGLDGTVSEQAQNAPTVLDVANGSADGPHGQWHRVIVEQIYHSLGDDRSVHGCLGDALAHVIEINKVAIKEPKFCAEVRPEFASKVSLGQSDLPTINQLCQHALCDIITSEKFNLLCKLLVENFEGAKVDRLLDFSIINLRVNEGVYERYPVLFLSDTKQVWQNLKEIGTKLVSLASSLTEIARVSCHEHLAKLVQPSSSGGGNCEVKGGNLQSDDKWKQAKTHAFYNECKCRHCGEKTDDQKCVVCHSCQDTYHVSFIQPSAEEIPTRNWYCTSCKSDEIRSIHENCSVCKKPNQNVNFANAEVLSNNIKDSKPESCKICGSRFSPDDKIRECEHSYCPNKYYHERCFTAKQLETHWTRWLCPSCLCRSCFTDQDDDRIILCDGCDDAYHMYCLKPPLDEVPPDKWFCRKCEVGIQAIIKVKRTYEVVKKKRGRKKKDKTVTTQEPKAEEVADKGIGMDMLLTAANSLNYEANVDLML